MVPPELIQDSRLKPSQRQILIAILMFADKDGRCFPKREQLYRLSNIPVKKISGITKELVQLGWLLKHGNGGRGKASNYQVVIPETVPNSGALFDSETSPDSATLSETNQPQFGTKTSPNLGLPIKQTSNRPNNIVTFETFWTLCRDNWYGSPGNKQEASKAFIKLNPDELLLQKIKQAIINQGARKKEIKTAGGFAPNMKHVTRWITNRCWEDELDAKPESVKAQGRPTDGMRDIPEFVG